MRTLDEINGDIQNLLKERSEVLSHYAERLNIAGYIGQYIKYTEDTSIKQTLLPVNSKKTYIIKVSDVANPGNEFISFAGMGVMIELTYHNEELYVTSLNMHVFMNSDELKNVEKISEDEFLEYVNKANEICNKIKAKEEGLKNGEHIVYSEKELKKLMKKYECETEEALDEYLWYNFGVSLVNKIAE